MKVNAIWVVATPEESIVSDVTFPVAAEVQLSDLTPTLLVGSFVDLRSIRRFVTERVYPLPWEPGELRIRPTLLASTYLPAAEPWRLIMLDGHLVNKTPTLEEIKLVARISEQLIDQVATWFITERQIRLAHRQLDEAVQNLVDGIGGPDGVN